MGLATLINSMNVWIEDLRLVRIRKYLLFGQISCKEVAK